MIPRIKHLQTQDNYKLLVSFDDGTQVVYDVKDDIDTIPEFVGLTTNNLFCQAQLDSSRTCVYWNDRIDLPSDTIQEYGKRVK